MCCLFVLLACFWISNISRGAPNYIYKEAEKDKDVHNYVNIKFINKFWRKEDDEKDKNKDGKKKGGENRDEKRKKLKENIWLIKKCFK